MGDDEEEVEDGDEGEVTPLGLTSTSFFSFRSTCLLFVPEEKERDKLISNKRVISTIYINVTLTQKPKKRSDLVSANIHTIRQTHR